MLVRWKEAALVARDPEPALNRSWVIQPDPDPPSPVKRRSESRNTSRSRSRSRSHTENRHHPQEDIGGATPGGKRKGPRIITWSDIVTGTKADSAQGHPLSGRPQAAADPGLARGVKLRGFSVP
ncbi:hypothetical protein MRX96_013443 [Rhipicephalus microplus]